METLTRLHVMVANLTWLVRTKVREDRGISMMAALIAIALLAGAAAAAFAVLSTTINNKASSIN